MATTQAIHPVHPAQPGPRSSVMSRVSWGAIFAGSVVTVALMILFTTFGVGIGAAVLDPQYDQDPGSGMGIGSGIYLVVTNIIALGIGGFIAARLAGVPQLVSSMLHGAAVWAVATIFVAWAAISGAGAMFGAASTMLGSTASAVGSAVQAVVPDDLSLPDPSQLASSISMNALPDEVQATLREKGVTEANIKQEATQAFRNVFSKEEQAAVMTEARQTLGDILKTPGDIGKDLSAFFDRLVKGPNAILSQEDAQQAMTVLERRLGITQQEAEGIVQSVEDSVTNSINEAKAAIEDARAQAIQTAQATSDAISKAALLLALALLLGLIAAGGGAFLGKPDSMVGDRADDHV